MKCFIWILLVFILAGCLEKTTKGISDSGTTTNENSSYAITITDENSYYAVTINYTLDKSYFDIGKELGLKIKEIVPEYEELLDSYLTYKLINDDNYNALINRVNDIKPNLNQDYQDEINGIASSLSGGNINVRGDGKISTDELFIFNLLADILRTSQCSALSVYGERSYSNQTMTARILDWDSGDTNQLAKIQSVVTFKNDIKSICTIGYLGFMGCISGFNNDKIFAAILDSSTGLAYDSENKSSYAFDIRYTLENYQTLDGVSDYLKNSERNYAFSHLVFLSDPVVSKVLENNVGSTLESIRDVRVEESILNDSISWGINNSIGAVNSFLLDGNFDNHTTEQYNVNRFEGMKSAITSKGDEMTLTELKEVASYTGSSYSGLLYNSSTQQIIIFEPNSLNLEIYFRPKSNSLPSIPTFESITVTFS